MRSGARSRSAPTSAILVTDDALAGADALATARVLAAAISRRPFDLVIAGVESTDGATGTMPMALAELLGVPAATFARRVVVSAGRVSIERQTSSGYEVIECELPALVTVTAGAAEPRYPSLRDDDYGEEEAGRAALACRPRTRRRPTFVRATR